MYNQPGKYLLVQSIQKYVQNMFRVNNKYQNNVNDSVTSFSSASFVSLNTQRRIVEKFRTTLLIINPVLGYKRIILSNTEKFESSRGRSHSGFYSK